MIERASKAKRDDAGTHVWVGAAYIPLGSERQAALAVKYGHTRVESGQEVDVPEVMCSICRKPYWRCWVLNPASGKKELQPCPRGDDATAHLRGGTPGVRKKRGQGDTDLPVVAFE